MLTYISADALWLITSQVRALLPIILNTMLRRGLDSIRGRIQHRVSQDHLRGYEFQKSKIVGAAT